MLGVVYAPVLKVMYYAAEGKAWKEECGVRKQIQVRDARPPLVVISRSIQLVGALNISRQQQASDNLYWFLLKITAPCQPEGRHNFPDLGRPASGTLPQVMPLPLQPGRTFTTGREKRWTIPLVNRSLTPASG